MEFRSNGFWACSITWLSQFKSHYDGATFYLKVCLSFCKVVALVNIPWLSYRGGFPYSRYLNCELCGRAGRVRRIPGVRIQGASDVSVVAFASDQFNIYRLSDALGKRGWNLNALQFPARSAAAGRAPSL